MVSARRLNIWMNGEFVGQWYTSVTGTPILEYDAGWLASPRARPLSLSLPFLPDNQPHRGERVAAWFDNLLPDSREIRQRLARRFSTGSTAVFDLLEAIGRDCVGAVQLLPAHHTPDDMQRLDAEPVGDSEVAKLLRSVTGNQRFGQVDEGPAFRISLAGAQEKTAFTKVSGRWCVPHGATPTTHILKLPLGLVGNLQFNLQDSVENEWLSMQLLGELGLPVANTAIATFRDEIAETKVLVVERFDRQFVAPRSPEQTEWIVRLPQEDFCQVFGLPPEQKYESDKGPGISQILTLLRGSENADEDVLTFAKSQFAFWLLAATDGHAKNFSIFLRKNGYRLTPLYDVLSVWPIIGQGPNEIPVQRAKLAMGIRGDRRLQRKIYRITTRHWLSLARESGVPGALESFVEMSQQVDGAIARVHDRLPAGFPGYVWDRITLGVKNQRDRFLNGLSGNSAQTASDDSDDDVPS